MQASDTELMLKGYGLTTAEFFYRMPDYRNVLNSLVWQEYDLAPDHPRLFKFIAFWESSGCTEACGQPKGQPGLRSAPRTVPDQGMMRLYFTPSSVAPTIRPA